MSDKILLIDSDINISYHIKIFINKYNYINYIFKGSMNFIY